VHTKFWSENVKRRQLLGRPRHKWDNILMVLQEIRYEAMVWIYAAQDRVQWWALVSMVMNILIP
jgi:hypothetical protein